MVSKFKMSGVSGYSGVSTFRQYRESHKPFTNLTTPYGLSIAYRQWGQSTSYNVMPYALCSCDVMDWSPEGGIKECCHHQNIYRDETKETDAFLLRLLRGPAAPCMSVYLYISRSPWWIPRNPRLSCSKTRSSTFMKAFHGEFSDFYREQTTEITHDTPQTSSSSWGPSWSSAWCCWL